MALLLTLLLALFQPAASDDVPKARRGTFALTNARIETVTNGTIERGTLVVRDDRIVALGPDVAVPPGAEVIDCTGLTVYPGLIDAGTHLGLVEVGSVDETNDAVEVGELTPQMQVLTALNPNSALIPVTRVHGVTTVLAEPTGGLFPGTAALVNLHGYTPAQMLVGDARAVVLQFPRAGRSSSWDRRSDEEIEKAAREAMERLDETWERARLFARIDSAYRAGADPARRPEYAPELEALAPVVRGERVLVVKVDAAKDIVAALDWTERQGVPRVVLSGVAEGWRVADRIAAAGVPCLVGPVLAMPSRTSDRYDRAYANAGLLRAAGVEVALRTGETENVRNLPYHAGFAAAYGLGRDEALRAVTLAPARIFGVADLLGSLEPGKQATLFVADGDPFEPRTHVRHIFIDGYLIPMDDRQRRLYDEFLERTPGLFEHDTPTLPATH